MGSENKTETESLANPWQIVSPSRDSNLHAFTMSLSRNVITLQGVAGVPNANSKRTAHEWLKWLIRR